MSSTAGTEQGKEVVVNDERKPILYDANGQPLIRQVGFQEVIGVPHKGKDKEYKSAPGHPKPKKK